MSHILSQITVSNFKSIISESFELSEFSPLVGCNNTGKSNLLEAIKWLLRKTALFDSSFYDINQPVEIVGKISGITPLIMDQLPENQRTAINYIEEMQFHKNSANTTKWWIAQIKLLVNDPANIGS